MVTVSPVLMSSFPCRWWSVGVSGGRVVATQVFGQALLLTERLAYGCTVSVHVGFLLGAAVVGPQLQHVRWQAGDGLEVPSLQCGVITVGFRDAELVPCPRD